MRKDKLFLIASCVDDSIKMQTAIYDITLFKSFVEFEKYVNDVPVIIDTLVVTSDELQFTNVNMERLKGVLQSPFVKVKGTIIYLIDNSYNMDTITAFFNSQELFQCSVYQGILNRKFVHDIISGEIRDSEEGQINIVTYRMRKAEYLKQRQIERFVEDNKYESDEDELSGIPVEIEPVELKPVIMAETEIYYIVGENNLERTLFAFLVAQYQALSKKTLIVERDVEYHTLTDIVTKSGVPHLLVTIDEVLNDVSGTITKIRNTGERLILLGAVNKVQYDYDFFFDILYNNLGSDIQCAIKELDVVEFPYNRKCTFVLRNTVPDVLRCCNAIQGAVNPNDVVFVGVQTSSLGTVNISSEEMTSVICVILGKEGIRAETVKVTGVVLGKEEGIYDIFSIISSPNRR